MLKVIEKPELPKEILAAKVQPQLVAQAVRVFLANQHQGTQSVLTRAEVSRTRKKLYKQKGTGGARHGDRKAPIFVGGGITFAPKPRDFTLKFAKKMRKLALFSVLAQKAKDKKLFVLSGLDKLSGKTSEIANFLNKLDDKANRHLIVTDQYRQPVWQSARNLPKVEILPVNQLNTYAVLHADQVLIMEEALANFNKKKDSANETSAPVKSKVTAKAEKPKIVKPSQTVRKAKK